MQTTDYTRNTAVKIDIATLRQGNFIENNQWDPNHIETSFGILYRVNLIGIIVSLNENNSSFLLDDGTGTILVNCDFYTNNDANTFKELKQGQCVLIIARPRKFNNEIFLVSEILKKINDFKWIKYRKLEIKNQKENKFYLEEINDSEHTKIDNITSNQKRNEIIYNNEFNSGKDNYESSKKNEDINDSFEIVNLFLRENDNGNGVNINSIIEELNSKNIENSENVVRKLLERGDIFEIIPGVVKLLK